MLEFDTGVDSPILLIMRIHLRVAPESKIPWFAPTLHNKEWMVYCQVWHGIFKNIPILVRVNDNGAYGHISLHNRSLPWHVRSYGWRYPSFIKEECSMQERLVLPCEVSRKDIVHILYRSYSKDGHASHFSTYVWSFPLVGIVQEVGHGNWYQSWGLDFVYYPIPRDLSAVCGEWILCQT